MEAGSGSFSGKPVTFLFGGACYPEFGLLHFRFFRFPEMSSPNPGTPILLQFSTETPQYLGKKCGKVQYFVDTDIFYLDTTKSST